MAIGVILYIDESLNIVFQWNVKHVNHQEKLKCLHQCFKENSFTPVSSVKENIKWRQRWGRAAEIK